jgi:hypothetical protein
METPLAAEYTAKQAGNLPHGEYRRIVVPVGSGMSLAGVIAGTPDETTIVGVSVGADPTKRLDRYAPMWRFRDVRMVQSEIPYGKPAPVSRLGDIKLDPIYEAKCLPFLQADDLFWIVGIRQTEQDEIHETKENKHA